METFNVSIETGLGAKIDVRRAVFLDRDGTLNIDSGYVHQIKDWVWISGAIEALSLLKQAGYLIVIVTNQAGVARGLYRTSDVDFLHDWVQVDLRSHGVEVDAFYYCPHHPDFGEIRDCACRKPKPGMLITASQDLRIDLRQSWMVGDKMSDIEAGDVAGLRTLLINSDMCEIGYHMQHPRKQVTDVLEAARFIISTSPAEYVSIGGQS